MTYLTRHDLSDSDGTGGSLERFVVFEVGDDLLLLFLQLTHLWDNIIPESSAIVVMQSGGGLI